MSLKSVDAAEAIATRFDAILDARSPAEFAEDHLPGAINWPVLDDEQRRVVGTLYVQQSPLVARKVGAALVARNIADHLDRWIADLPREWQPLVYCWRGGQRSGALAWFLDQIGFRTTRLAGGYKGFRALVRNDLAEAPARLQFTVLAGRTGSGKTRLLHALAAEGAQVLDLEALACHRGSVLGGLPGRAQPSQKRFDTLLWQQLRAFDATRPVFVESESKKVGRLHLPDALIARMQRDGTLRHVQMADDARLQLLLEDYGFFAQDGERFCALLQNLVELRGKETVARWQALARAGEWAAVFGALMREHYDPLYTRSIDRQYSGQAGASVVALADGGADALRAAARTLLDQPSST
ncbi:MAG: tRNA 2-selenouridine(34) synthase MnmH [Burkholderiales bacterium]|nr:tRNA 2-selenouridine(34) synthase MnmH [Burkholderiales bacterium]